MKLLLIITAILFLYPSYIIAQSKLEKTIKKDQIKTGIIFLGGGINYEKRIFPFTTLNLNAELSYGFGRSNVTGNSTSYYALTPIFFAEGRNYYNICRRLRKGKRIYNNSGDFWAIAAGIKTAPFASDKYYESPVAFGIPSWGMQRGLGRNFTFSAQFGWAFKYSIENKKWSGSPNIRAGIYFILK